MSWKKKESNNGIKLSILMVYFVVRTVIVVALRNIAPTMWYMVCYTCAGSTLSFCVVLLSVPYLESIALPCVGQRRSEFVVLYRCSVAVSGTREGSIVLRRVGQGRRRTVCLHIMAQE